MKKLNKFVKRTYSYIKKNPSTLLVIGIIVFAFLLRIYDIENKSPFGWDQVDNAWVAKNIIIDQNFPLLGMQAKLNSEVFIGPFYYYLVALFYFFTNLDPIASGLIAAFTSLFSFIVLYFIAKKIFSKWVGIIAIFLNAVSFSVILSDRVQWPVNFIPVVGLLIFFSLYKILNGNPRYILLLALSFGFSLHVHFTFVYYPIIFLLAFPLFPRTREVLKNLAYGSLILIPFLIPIFMAFANSVQNTSSIFSYGQHYYHGLHLRRVIQLTGDAFIQFEPYLKYDLLKFLKFILAPLFFVVYLSKNVTREKLTFCYLVLIFYGVPWLIMSTYSGSITNYYFDITRFLSLIIISYLIYRLFIIKNVLLKILLIILLGGYAFVNLKEFILFDKENSLSEQREEVKDKIDAGVEVEFKEGVPEPYLYYYYTNIREENS